MLKRLFDILFSSIGIILSSPILLLIALGIKLTSRGPILYRGVRVGRNGKDFSILKFRSMVTNADQIGGSSTAEDDNRITGIGKLIRKTKMDELPQLFNVLAGQMSFVGPRPQVRWAVDLYSDEEQQLLEARPGITDFASLVFRNEGEILKGSKDPDADYLRLIAPRKIELGLYYVRHRSIWMDVKIITATVLAVMGVSPNWCIPESLDTVPMPPDDVSFDDSSTETTHASTATIRIDSTIERPPSSTEQPT